MNNFCEECGSKIVQGDKFCQNCGNSVNTNQEQVNEVNSAFDFFYNKKSIFIDDNQNYQFGILLTNFKQLIEKFGIEKTEKLKQSLNVYLNTHKKNGIIYLLLDTSDNYLLLPNKKNWKQHVKLLIKGVKTIKKKINSKVSYILLLGGDEIIPMPVFPNPVPSLESDIDVDSDLPYSTLSVSEDLNKEENRTPVIMTGRIPTGIDTTVDDIINLLNNTQDSMKKFSTEKTFGLSAFVWSGASNYVNNNVCKESLFLSPNITVENIDNHYDNNINIHYFNLHGSNSEAEWMGQKSTEYPKAFSPSKISNSKVNNILGVEACYGARFINLRKQDSILLSALSTKTISFVGSSRIALGPADPPISLADIIIHDYLGEIQSGLPAGGAFIRARNHAFLNNIDKDPTTGLLTIIEFNLFGDPAFCINSVKNIKSDTFSTDATNLKEIPENDLVMTKSSTISNFSTYSIITNAVDTAQRKINEAVNKNIWNKYPDFKGIAPKYHEYKFNGKTFKQLSYKKEQKLFDQFIIVNTNDSGEIINESLSK